MYKRIQFYLKTIQYINNIVLLASVALKFILVSKFYYNDILQSNNILDFSVC